MEFGYYKKASIRWQDSAPEAKCVQRRCFQCGSVPLRSDIKKTKLPPVLIPLERQLIALQRCRWEFLYNEILQHIGASFIVEIVQKTTNIGNLSPFGEVRGGTEPWLMGRLESPCRVLVKCNWTSFSISYGWGATRQNVSKLAAFSRG